MSAYNAQHVGDVNRLKNKICLCDIDLDEAKKAKQEELDTIDDVRFR